MVDAADWYGVPKLSPGSRVLVAGASGGIGRAVLRMLLSSEVKIGAHYLQHATEIQAELTAAGATRATVELFAADLSRPAAGRELVRSFVAWAGGIDVLIQVTGSVRQVVQWDELDERHWDDDLAVNLKGPFFLAQAAMREMRSRGGRVVLTSTASAQHGGGTNTIAYGVSKAGIEFLAKSLARIGAPHGILVNAIAPGFIDTAFHTRRVHRTPEQLRERAQLVPLKRAATPAEVAGIIVFLASPLGSYITGETIAVSGGDWL